ncbi:MAG: RidA family protein [SAR324 cluster bacterium]|jgi:enamine deaminase RidA (YjgF/YER057c/UK114 family)|nr:RidA family protein [SAR324 cluster bacterium]
MSAIEDRLSSLGIQLPQAPPPAGNYVGAVRFGNLVYLSGHGPLQADGTYLCGKVPDEISSDDAYQSARLTGLNLLATLKAEIGDLDQVKRVVKVLGMVNASPDFKGHPQVINGFSDLMVEVFGEPGRGARSAVGMGSLPNQIPVEVEMIVEVQ